MQELSHYAMVLNISQILLEMAIVMPTEKWNFIRDRFIWKLADLTDRGHFKTLGIDKAYDTREVNQAIREHIEECFGRGRTAGRLRKKVYRGIRRVDRHFKLTMVAGNLRRMARILFVVPQKVTP